MCARAMVRPGFTLPELVFVMAIVGVLSAIVVPRIELVRFRLDGAARGAAGALVAAQRLAVQRQHDVTVAFDRSGNRLLIHEDANNDGARDAEERVRAVALDERIRFGLGAADPRSGWDGAISFDEEFEGLPAFRFLRNGSATAEGAFYLTSTRSAGGDGSDRRRAARDTRSLHVDRATGRVTWFRYGASGWEAEY